MPIRIHARVVDLGSSRVEALTEDGELIAMDADPPHGSGGAAGPKEMVLAALAGCTAMDVASLLRKKRQPADAYEVEVSGESAEAHPRVFTSILVEHVVAGEVDPEALRRSVELSATRYCPVNAMLSGRVRIEHRYRLTRPGQAEVAVTVAVIGPVGGTG